MRPHPNPVAHLTANLTWNWQDARGRDHEADAEVEYTITDGEFAVTRISAEVLPDREIDALCDYVETEIAPEAYAEWLAEYGEYLRAAADDRRAAA